MVSLTLLTSKNWYISHFFFSFWLMTPLMPLTFEKTSKINWIKAHLEFSPNTHCSNFDLNVFCIEITISNVMTWHRWHVDILFAKLCVWIFFSSWTWSNSPNENSIRFKDIHQDNTNTYTAGQVSSYGKFWIKYFGLLYRYH